MNTINNIIFFLILIIFIGCGNKENSKKEVILKPVKYSVVKLTGGLQEKNFSGTSQSGSQAKLSFRANGLITKLNVKVGSRVKKGQLLAKLDSKDSQLGYENAKTNLINAEIQLKTAKSSLNRIKQLYLANNASLNDYEKAKSSFSTANSSFESAKKSLDLKASQLEYSKIISPTNGVVTAVNSEINEFINAGSPVVVISSQKDNIEINIGIPEAYISKVKNGKYVKVNFSSIPNKEFKGVITEVGYSTAGFLTYPVTVKILNNSSEIRPGMPANVFFKFGNKNELSNLTVNVKAVSEDAEGNFVYVISKDGKDYKVTKQKIEIGPLNNNGFIVLSGLKENDMVAIAGLRSLYNGRKVKLLE